MPLGDPCGGEFTYADEGLPVCISAVTINVSSLQVSYDFYTELLGFRLFDKEEGKVYLKRGDAVIILRKSEDVGKDTGLYLGVDNPFDLHRRLIDEAVIFIRDPMNSPIGVYTTFLDPDRNVINAVDKYGKMERP